MQFVTVMDLEGIGIWQRVGLPYLLATVAHDDKYYPNFLGKVYILNAGWLFPMLWQAVKPTLPDFISKHIELVSDVKKEMSNYIPAKNLPKRYGGEADDIPILDTSDLKSASATEYQGEDLEEANIAYASHL